MTDQRYDRVSIRIRIWGFKVSADVVRALHLLPCHWSRAAGASAEQCPWQVPAAPDTLHSPPQRWAACPHLPPCGQSDCKPDVL